MDASPLSTFAVPVMGCLKLFTTQVETPPAASERGAPKKNPHVPVGRQKPPLQQVFPLSTPPPVQVPAVQAAGAAHVLTRHAAPLFAPP